MSFQLFFLLLSPSSAEEQSQCGPMHWASKTCVVVVQSLSCVWLLQPHGLQHTRLPCHSLSPRVCPNSCPLSGLCHPTISSLCCLLLLLPSVFCSIRVFSNEAALHISWAKIGAAASVLPSSEYSGLISFRIDGFDLLAVQGTLKSLLQHHNLKHQFFGNQLSLWSDSHTHTWLLEKPYLWLYGPLLAKWCFCFLICCLGLRAT